MFPVYPLICFNAAATLYLVRGWLEVIHIKITKSPYRASRSTIFSTFTFLIVLTSMVTSTSRVIALHRYYHAPIDLAHQFQTTELPRLLRVTGLIPPSFRRKYSTYEDTPDLSGTRLFNLTLCLGKEWYRFPSHYLIEDGISVEFIKSDFSGLLPRHFERSYGADPYWKMDGTRYVPQDLNDLNIGDERHYVDVSICDYLIDSDFPARQQPPSAYEPRYAIDADWDRVLCLPFLDASMSHVLTRTLWVPGPQWQARNTYGDYCLLRNRQLSDRESLKWTL